MIRYLMLCVGGLLMLTVPVLAQEGEENQREFPPAIGEPVVYKKVDNRELKANIVKPKDWKATDKRPALVLFHGGGWKGGAPSKLNPQAEYFAERGMVCVLVEYRLISKKKTDTPETCCNDAKSAMRWVRGHASELGID